MSVKKEANGRRSISVEVEVPGTPEEVWDAIATDPGISKWFVPAPPIAVAEMDVLLVNDWVVPAVVLDASKDSM